MDICYIDRGCSSEHPRSMSGTELRYASLISVIYTLVKTGESTLTCLKGDDLPIPRDTTTVQQCGPHEYCSLEQYITPNGFIRHKASCKDKQICGGTTVLGTYMVVCSECCDTNLCSASGCNSAGYNQTRGNICYHCGYAVDKPQQCDKIRICSADEVCAMHRTPYGKYQVGCESKLACNTIKNIGVCSTCCTTDLCNTQCTVQSGATTPAATCKDSHDCQTIMAALTGTGKDACQDANLKHFCNYTCGLCPGQTTRGTTTSITSSSKSFTTVALTSTTSTVLQTTPTTAPHLCSPNPCLHGTCYPVTNSFVCACNPGYTGATCDKTDPCYLRPCVHGTCVVIPGSFHCTCHANFTGRSCDTAIVPDPCLPNPCVHGACSPSGQNYICQCSSGYSGPTCAVPDPCLPNPCVHGACSPSGQNYICQCRSGYSGPTCAVQDPCSPNPCAHGKCTHQGSAFTCSCNSGYTGTNCAQVDHCASKPCVHGTCTTSTSGYNCACPSGYTGNTCSSLIVQNPCLPNPCLHGTCIHVGSSYSCKCNSGYIGQTCNTRDPCSSVPCIHGSCSSTSSGSYHCHCQAGYTGAACDTDIDECQSNPCLNGYCQDQVNGYKCVCKAGYTGAHCQTDIDECQSRPCSYGFCHNEVNGYTCQCFPGYTGKQCATNINDCAPTNPCQHGTCNDLVSGFSCTCNHGYTGTTCDKVAKIRDCKDVLSSGQGAIDGKYRIDVGNTKQAVVCDMTTVGGGWTVLLSRHDGSVHFTHKDSNDYALGFGNKRDGDEFWAGLELMHTLTSDGRRYQLRVDLTAANGSNYYQTYDDFRVGPAKDFTLHVGVTRGTAGDSLSGHSGFGFTTYDRDVDNNPTNCAVYLSGAWWFHDCYDSCLTCPYIHGVTPGTLECSSMSWNSVRYCEPLKAAKMMIRPM